jgi:hypothetical protein
MMSESCGGTTSGGRRLGGAKLGLLLVLAIIAAIVCAATLPALADAPTPTVGADVPDARIMLSDWPAGSTVHVILDSDNNPSNGILAAADITMDDGTWKDTNELGATSLQGLIAAGQYVTASQAATTKTLQIVPLTVGGVDLGSDVVTGTCDPGTPVNVHTWDNSGNADWSVETTASLSGEWSADFTGIHTIVRNDNGAATITDGNGDWTEADWSVPNPNVWVVVAPSDQLNLEEWPAGSTVHVDVDTDTVLANGSLFSGDVNIDGNGNGNMDQGFIDDHGGLHAGQYVTATQGSVTKVLLISNMGVNMADTAGDNLGGWAAPGTLVHAWADNGGDAEATATNGSWVVHLPGGDIVPGEHGMAAALDADGDATRADWTATGLTVKAPSKIKRGKSVGLTISGQPIDIGGEWVRVEVKKPGKKTWTLVTRIVIPRTGAWPTSYATTKSNTVGTYSFRAVYAGGWADLMGCTKTVNVKVTK